MNHTKSVNQLNTFTEEKTETKYDLNHTKSVNQFNTFTGEKTESGYLQNHAICIDMEQILSES